MKALILAGGSGSRLRPITFSMAKQLLPVANKPVIEYGIEQIARAGIREFGIIIGDTGDAVRAALGDGSRWGIELTYIPQAAPLGLAHAVRTAQPFLQDDPFVMFLGDNLLKSSIEGLVQEFEAHQPAATILLAEVPNPSQFGVAEMAGERVVRLEEKPASPRSNLALVGVYLFSPQIHSVIETLQPSARGEYEITDAIQGLIDAEGEVRSVRVEGWWKDTGTVEAILEANRLILEDLSSGLAGEVEQSAVEGRVQIGRGTVVRNSTIRGPVVIAENCHIEESFIGPFTSIDAGTRVIRSEIENSIVLSECSILDVPARISSSLLGRGVRVVRSEGRPQVSRLVLGDSSSVELP
ncbi:MAG TPA: glucose-1-phosphate thymidylyltransferase [Fimbriimonadaceae bacterium]|mgnify:CR=1 FL=1|nr:glucose-1-phosphate thymidylyltransferase [Fimbriimonadaceae bacterium]HRJ32872.1 glucose-1-phosphate thymidylyltransferase [Fimbriimonadaceae bacterium]